MACECGYISVDRSNFRRHQRTCRVTRETTVKALRAGLDQAHSDLRDRDGELVECRRRIARLEECIVGLKRTRTVKTTVRDCNIFVANIFPYDSEPTVLAPNQVHTLLETAPPDESVPRFVQLKHFCGPHASRNIYLPNKRGNTVCVVETVENGRLRWVHRDRKDVVDDMLERNLDELRTNYRAERIIPWKEWLISSGLASIQRRSTPAWKEQLAKLELLLMNNPRSGRDAQVPDDVLNGGPIARIDDE